MDWWRHSRRGRLGGIGINTGWVEWRRELRGKGASVSVYGVGKLRAKANDREGRAVALTKKWEGAR